MTSKSQYMWLTACVTTAEREMVARASACSGVSVSEALRRSVARSVGSAEPALYLGRTDAVRLAVDAAGIHANSAARCVNRAARRYSGLETLTARQRKDVLALAGDGVLFAEQALGSLAEARAAAADMAGGLAVVSVLGGVRRDGSRDARIRARVDAPFAAALDAQAISLGETRSSMLRILVVAAAEAGDDEEAVVVTGSEERAAHIALVRWRTNCRQAVKSCARVRDGLVGGPALDEADSARLADDCMSLASTMQTALSEVTSILAPILGMIGKAV